MKLAIRYRASFRYDEPVSFSPHTVRLFPRCDQFVSILRREFVAPGADTQLRSDIFDNPVAVLFYPELTSSLEIGLELDLEITERNPFHFLLAPHALEMPFRYRPDEAAALGAFVELDPAHRAHLPEALAPRKKPEPSVDRLVEMNSWIHANIAYERREFGGPLSPQETLRSAAGSCRDMAVLFASALRASGIAARLVSGFLWEPATAERVAENALHAWVEAYLPGAGWTGFDPTNGVLADHHRIAAAAGIRHEDIAPIDGHYYGDRAIASALEAHLDILPL